MRYKKYLFSPVFYGRNITAEMKNILTIILKNTRMDPWPLARRVSEEKLFFSALYEHFSLLHGRFFSVVRLEEKENEMKKEYSKLHERYTELFKTHIDYMERTKSILGTERLDQLGPGAARPRIAGMALNQLNR
jgi:hypothetical protein